MSIHASSVMSKDQHRFGVDSQDPHTALVFDAHTNLVASKRSMPKQVKKTKKSTPAPKRGPYANGLAEAMAARPKLTQGALAKEIGTSQQQIGKLLHGVREMTAHWAERLAPVLQVAPERLVFPDLKHFRVPVYSWVSAGKLFAQDGVRKTDVQNYLLVSGLPKGDWIVLQIDGDSMNRIAPDGSYIFVNRADETLIDDRFYVFSTPDGAATFKRYRSGRPPRLQPFSTNPDHETIILTDEMNLIGRVGRVVTDLR